MKLSVICSNCKNEIPVGVNAPDLGILRVEYGETINMECRKCENRKDYIINRIYATGNPFATLVTFFISLGLVFVFTFVASFIGINGVYFYGSIGGIPLLIFATVQASQKRKLRIFNSYRV